MREPLRIGMPHWPEPFWAEPDARGPHATMRGRMQALLERLDNPQSRLPPVVHVAGTNGKGSTIAFLRAFLEAAGHRVHVYTSPHLHRFEERIRLAGATIAPPHLHALLERARLACGEDLRVRFFEGTTAAALLAFAETPADVLLVETGMGGHDDPTSLLAEAAATILTPIGLDHLDHLGPGLGDIAWHKSGILKAGVPCIVAQQMPEAMAVIEVEAARIGAPLLVFGRHWAAQLVEIDREPALRFADAHGETFLPTPNLPGAHQAMNAGAAIAALTVLDGFDVPAEAVAEGLQSAQWPARLERITGGALAAALPAGWELWMDGGHNADGAQAIAAHAARHWKDRPLYLIFGTTAGKAMGAMLAPLLPHMTRAFGVPVRAEPKSAHPSAILQAAMGTGFPMHAAASLAEAVDDLCTAACAGGDEIGSAPGRILVFGSLYLHLETVQP